MPKFEISEGIESIRPTGQPDDKLQHFKYGTEIVQTTTTYNEVGMLRVEKED